jgi:hypothetical protein
MHPVDESVAITVDIIDNGRHVGLIHHIAGTIGAVAKPTDLFQIFRMDDPSIFNTIQKMQQLSRKIG